MPIKRAFNQADQPQGDEKNNGPAYWRRWHIAVIVFLVAQVIIYSLITQHFK